MEEVAPFWVWMNQPAEARVAQALVFASSKAFFGTFVGATAEYGIIFVYVCRAP